MIEIKKFTNCFCDLTLNNQEISRQKFNNFYLKVKCSDLEKLNIVIKSTNISLEITDIYEDLNIFLIKEVIDKLKINRVVLTYKILKNSDINCENKKFQIIDEIKKINFENLAIDFYLGDINQEFLKYLNIFLINFSNVKHFSIYFLKKNNPGFFVKSKILSFYRYHKHMWAKHNFHSSFDLICLIEKNYLGIGNDAVSRFKDMYYRIIYKEGVWKSTHMNEIKQDFVEFNDHIDRLSFYYELTKEEIEEKYKKINGDKYFELLKKCNNDIYILHDYIVEAAFNSDKFIF